MGDSAIVAQGVVVVAAVVAAVTDIWRFKVYNAMTFPLMISGLVYHVIEGGWPALSSSLGGALFGFVILIIPYLAGGMGAGDVKFLAGVGAWLGLPSMLIVALVGFLATGVYGVVLTAATGRLRETWLNLQVIFYRFMTVGHYLRAGDQLESVQTIAQQPDRKQRLIPVSAMMALGVVVNIIWQASVKSQ